MEPNANQLPEVISHKEEASVYGELRAIAERLMRRERRSNLRAIQVDLSAAVLRRFRSELLDLIQTSGARGVILDVSGVEIMDCRDFEELSRIMTMAHLMGAPSVLTGLQAGVVSSLVEMGAETEGIATAMDLDDAFRVMDHLRSGHAPGGAEDGENERPHVTPSDHI